MIQAFLSTFINILASLIQIILSPINLVITNALPNLSDKILIITNTFASVFDSLSWGLGLLPNSVIITLIFILTCEIGKHAIYLSTHTIIRLWNLIQVLKVW